MTKEEMAVKTVLGKHIIEDMMNEWFWRALVNGRIDRFMAAVQRALERLPLPKIPETDEEASDLLFSWTLPVRAEVSLEFIQDARAADQAARHHDTDKP